MNEREDAEEDFAGWRAYFRDRDAHNFELQDLEDIILDLAKEGKTATYGKFLRRYHISRGGLRGIGNLLDAINARGRCRASGCTNSLHHVSAVVVLANTDYPSGGFFGVDGIPAHLERSERQWKNPTLKQEEKDFVKQIWTHLRQCPATAPSTK